MRRSLGQRAFGVTAGGALLAFVACGTSKPPFADESFAPDASSDPFATEDARPQCEMLSDGGPCGCLEMSFLTDVPNLYFVLDRSGSMSDENKWSTIRSVVSNVIQRIGPRAVFGAAVFPRSGGECAAGGEVMSARQGDAPAGRRGPVVQAFLSATNLGANGGTPTAATLRSLTPALTAMKGRTFVVLATDGGPNCDLSATCDASTCIANVERFDPSCDPAGASCCTAQLYGPGNCLDAAATEAAVQALKAAGVPTYVIGVPGSGPYAALLDRLAQAGGTARQSEPFYYRVDTSDEAALGDAFASIAAKVTARCDLPLNPPPADPSQVNVYFDDAVVPADPDNGWKLVGSTVQLVGAACQRVLAGNVLNLRVIGGCPTVAPK